MRFFRRLRKTFGQRLSKLKAHFGRPQSESSGGDVTPRIESEPKPVPQTATRVSQPVQRRGRLWNIGLDFGTAFTKCIVRNLGTEEAFIVPLGQAPYLLSSEVLYGNGELWMSGDATEETDFKRALNLKMALADAVGQRKESAWLSEFRRMAKGADEEVLTTRLKVLTTYYLARVVQQARAFIVARTSGFNEALGDQVMVNMAIPVSHAQQTAIASVFESCLRCAYSLAREPSLSIMAAKEVENALLNCSNRAEQDIGCYVYPEVSANVQSYIKSRAGMDGLYLFVDVGAGTVDVSIFIYYTHETNDRPISYPAAGVIPLGSSQIEMRVAQRLSQEAGGGDAELERLQEFVRLVKEGENTAPESVGREIRAVERLLEDEVFCEAAPILVDGRSKIRRTPPNQYNQWRSLKILLGGGGADARLYYKAVNRWFQQFSHFEPESKPIPLPRDLIWPTDIPEQSQTRIFRRFSVAYGLSFDRANLADHRYPNEVMALPEEGPPPPQPEAPSKDEC